MAACARRHEQAIRVLGVQQTGR